VADRFALHQEVCLAHNVLLGNRDDMEDVRRAMEKLHRHRRELAEQPPSGA
jgi:hypothetical protein